MKYVNLTFKYLKNNPALFLPAFITGLLATFFSSNGTLRFLASFTDGTSAKFFDVYRTVSAFFVFPWWAYILVFLGLTVVIAYMVGVIERDMKIGDFSMGRPFKKINENFFVVMPVLFAIIVANELVNVSVGLFISLFFSTLDFTLAYVLSIVLYVLLNVGEIILLSVGALWLPHISQSGLRAGKAFSGSVYMIKDHVMKVAAGIIVMHLPMLVITYLASVLSFAAQIAVTVLTLGVFTVYVTVYVFTAYFELSGLQREDLKAGKNIWRK